MLASLPEMAKVRNITSKCIVVFPLNAESLLVHCFRLEGESRQSLSLKATSSILPDMPRLLSRFSFVQKLVLKCERNSLSVDDAALDIISRNCNYLRKLKLKNCKQVREV